MCVSFKTFVWKVADDRQVLIGAPFQKQYTVVKQTITRISVTFASFFSIVDIFQGRLLEMDEHLEPVIRCHVILCQIDMSDTSISKKCHSLVNETC